MTNPPNESAEMYSVAQIRAAFQKQARPDDWGVACFYEDSLISALRRSNGRKSAYKLAELILEVDGAHDLTAAALAESLIARGVELSS